MKKIYILTAFLWVVFSNFSFGQNTPTNCTAQFNITPTGNTVQCTPVMMDSLTAHYWSFGDGGSSSIKNPAHTYNVCGTYTIGHYTRQRNPNGVITCSDSAFVSVVIACNTSCNVHASFTSAIVNNQSNVFQFTNTSAAPPSPTPVYSIWNFGDGTPVVTGSGLTNPSHTYTTSGLFNVCLKVISGQTVAGMNCLDSICQTIQVQVPGTNTCNINPTFSIQPSPNQPNVIVFTNTTVQTVANPAISWSFGDSTTGSGNSITHTYNHAGTFSVCMHIAVSSTCIKDTCVTITVTMPTPPPPTPCTIAPGFSWSINQTQSNIITFTNTSTPINTAASVSWNFGDSTTGTGYIATHTYTHAGIYTVCMYVSNSNTCSAYLCQTVTVTLPTNNPCNIVAGFNFQNNPTGASSNTVYFNNQSTPLAATDSITWNFGDGTVSHDINPIHTYANAGTYNVCLVVRKNPTPTGAAPCVSYICHVVTITGSQPCTLASSFTWHRDSINYQTIHFYNTTYIQNTTAAIMWSFGDGTSSTVFSPVHQYSFPGHYYVCLRVQTSPNCVAYYCDSIIVGTPNTSSIPQCQLMPIPNPAHSQVSVNAYLAAAMPINVFVYNAQNVCVKRLTITGVAGNNTIALNVYNLVAGFYTIRLYYGNQFCFARFQKI